MQYIHGTAIIQVGTEKRVEKRLSDIINEIKIQIISI